MEPREVYALYEGYEWRHRREAGLLAFLIGQSSAREINVERLVKAAETWQPEERKRVR